MEDTDRDTSPDFEAAEMQDDEVAATVRRLSRKEASGAVSIERAAIVAEGSRSTAILKWILDNGGEPEVLPAAKSGGGLHGSRLADTRVRTGDSPRRYLLPAEAVALSIP